MSGVSLVLSFVFVFVFRDLVGRGFFVYFINKEIVFGDIKERVFGGRIRF